MEAMVSGALRVSNINAVVPLCSSAPLARVNVPAPQSAFAGRPFPASSSVQNVNVVFHKRSNAVICAASSSAAVVDNVEKAREELLDAISGVGGRGKDASEEQKKVIAKSVAVLEGEGGVADPTASSLIEGRWQLMYTTRPGTASPIQRTFVGVDAFTVHQEINLRGSDEPRVSNIINFGEKIGELKVEAAAAIANGKRINFGFDRAAFNFKFVPFRVPYPVPFRLLGDEAKGWLDTVYLSPSGDLRISKGNKGTTFVLQKNPGPRQRLISAVRSKRNVEKMIEEMQALNPNPTPAESDVLPGKWRLIWSTQADNANPLQKLSAGFANNFQVIASDASGLENLVELFGGLLKLRAGADCTVASPVRTSVKVKSAQLELGPLKIPLNLKGEGWVEQLYLDDKIRISKGNKGSTFIHVREQ